jgi:hypothetical protein
MTPLPQKTKNNSKPVWVKDVLVIFFKEKT